MSNPDVVPIITAAQAVQALIEAVQQFERQYLALKEPLRFQSHPARSAACCDRLDLTR